MLAHLLEDSHLATLERLPGLVEQRAAPVGLSEILILLADLREQSLVALHPDGKRTLPVDASLAGRARRPLRDSTAPPSSPRMPSSGKFSASSVRMKASDSRSAAVTSLPSDFLSVATVPKWRRVISPARWAVRTAKSIRLSRSIDLGEVSVAEGCVGPTPRLTREPRSVAGDPLPG
jgi:hypothetical protein